MEPHATIIVPLLRQHSDYLKACLDSALAQSVPCEILVVASEKSPRETLDIVEAYRTRHGNLRLLLRRRPPFAAAINTGIDAAGTPRVGLLLSDDWLEPHTVERCLERDADIVSTNMAIYDESGTRRLEVRTTRTMTRYAQFERLHERASYLGHFFMFKRDALLRVGGVDETIGNVGPDDFDLIWSLLEIGASVDLVEEKLYCYRDHPGERLTLRPREDQIRDLGRILDKHGISDEERARMIARHSRWFGKTLQQVFNEG